MTETRPNSSILSREALHSPQANFTCPQGGLHLRNAHAFLKRLLLHALVVVLRIGIHGRGDQAAGEFLADGFVDKVVDFGVFL